VLVPLWAGRFIGSRLKGGKWTKGER